MEYITLVLAAIAVILGILILLKVNKISNDQHTPIVKRVSETNLKPGRHAVSSQEMASRGNGDRHDSGRGSDRRERNSSNGNRQDRGFNRDRGDRRNNSRNNGRRRDFNAEAPAASGNAPAEQVQAPAAQVQPSAPAEPAPAVEAPRNEGRRPLPPRVQASLPEAPAASAAPAPVQEESVGAEFDPAKVRYGRRNAIKKIPVEEETSEA